MVRLLAYAVGPVILKPWPERKPWRRALLAWPASRPSCRVLETVAAMETAFPHEPVDVLEQ